jgi:hypothetical protein
MKKIYLSLIAALFSGYFVSAQNTFPSTGNVGIGTTLPLYRLHVNTGTNENLQVRPFAFGSSGILLNAANDANLTNIPMEFAASSFSFNNGRVGIGTTSPSSLLSLNGGAFSLSTTNGQFTLANIDNSSTSPLSGGGLLGLYAGDLMVRSFWGVSIDLNDGLYGDNSAATYTRIPSTSSFTINSRTNSTTFNTLFAVRNNGNVLIGETSQINTAYKLDVNGNVRANGVVVNTTGADFVFGPSYRLSSLSSLKKYIDRNRHLPEIASAKQMQANGLNIGDNQTKLLQKVEELTLYLIEKDNEVKAQSAQLKSQREQINKLSQQVQYLLKTSEKH